MANRLKMVQKVLFLQNWSIRKINIVKEIRQKTLQHIEMSGNIFKRKRLNQVKKLLH